MDEFEEDNEEIFNKENPWKERPPNTCLFRCKFQGCDLTSVKFRHLTFSECQFENCNLSLSSFEWSQLQGVQFQGCKLVGVDFTKCDPKWFAISFRSCRLQTCNFTGMKLKKSSFLSSSIIETYFQEADLTESDFKEAQLSGSLFHHTNLTQANFIGASQYRIDPRHNQLKGARFSLPEAVSLLDGLEIFIEK